MANTKLFGNEAFIIEEALKYYGQFMKKQIRKAEKNGHRTMFHETFFEMMGERIIDKLPQITYKEKKSRKF